MYLEQAKGDKLTLHLGDTRAIYEKRVYMLYHITFRKTYCDVAEAELIVATWHTESFSQMTFPNAVSSM